jgi:hypothetical protein
VVSSGGEGLTVAGDWDDVGAAVLVGVEAAECVVHRQTEDGPRRAVFELRTVRDEPGELVAERSGDAETGPIRLRARLGRFGDPQREELVLRATARRLERLRGVEFAPVGR